MTDACTMPLTYTSPCPHPAAAQLAVLACTVALMVPCCLQVCAELVAAFRAGASPLRYLSLHCCLHAAPALACKAYSASTVQRLAGWRQAGSERRRAGRSSASSGSASACRPPFRYTTSCVASSVTFLSPHLSFWGCACGMKDARQAWHRPLLVICSRFAWQPDKAVCRRSGMPR